MVAKITFVLLIGVTVVYSAPAGFDLKDGPLGNILNQGKDVFPFQGQKGIQEAGEFIKDHVKGGLEHGHKVIEQGIQKAKDDKKDGKNTTRLVNLLKNALREAASIVTIIE